MFLIVIRPLSLRQLIYNYPEQLFADTGMMAIEHADFEGIERLALVLGESDTRASTAERGRSQTQDRTDVLLCCTEDRTAGTVY